jgi:hypothetical protein
MFLMNMDNLYNESMYPAPQQQRRVFPVNNFSVPYRGAYREFLCYPLFNRLFTEQEYDYLHALVDRKLTWSLNPFKLYERLMQGLSPHMGRIEQERPDLARKISRFRPDMALQLIRPAARSGFPNR